MKNLPEVTVITGGVASGKSAVLSALRQRCGEAAFFDSDLEVYRALTSSEIRVKIGEHFGRAFLHPDGTVAKRALRGRIFENPEDRAFLENLLHPVVARRFHEEVERGRQEGRRWVIADIPLFFETQEKFPAVRVVAVAAQECTQMERLIQRDGIDQAMAMAMIQAQMPMSGKMRRADQVLWNEGSRAALEEQVDLLCGLLEM
ncbi:MAG TPA: dephospho-CoA kinase [Verrucomicrobiales bacterium]|nr:dephospho-CoA kinase [Verrucomicrobiales bacterium]